MCGQKDYKASFVRCGGNVLAAFDDAEVSNSFPNLVNDRSLGSFDNSSVVGPKANGANCPPPFGPNKDDPIPMPNLPPQQMRQMTLQEGTNSTTKQK